MKFNSKIKIEQAAAKNDARPALHAVHYNKAAHRLEASDGFMLCILAVTDDEQDVDALIPLAAVTEARVQAKKYGECELMVGEKIAMTKNGTAYNLIDGVFPNVQAIIPETIWDKPAFLEVSGEFLERCGKVFGAAGSGHGKGKIALRRQGTFGPMLVTSVDVANAFMLLMPLSNAKVINDGETVDAPLPEIPVKLRGTKRKAKR